MTLAAWTQQQILAQLDSGSHWSAPAILYRFPTVSSEVYAPSGEGAGFQALNVTQQQMARVAFATWGDLIAKPVSEVSQWAQIAVANTTTGIEFAHAYFPSSASVWFNTNEAKLQNPQIGQYGFETFIHEFGHALGLDHMGDYNGSGDWTPSCYQDSTVYTVMPYFGPDHDDGEGQVAWANWTAGGLTYSPQTPMLNDIQAIQSIYGANTSTRSGDTVYGFNSNVTGSLSAIYNFSQNLHPILTVYDTGGADTLDLSGWGTASRIDLNGGAFSDCNSMTNNLCIASSSVIENLTTGGGADTLTGNSAANRLIAGAGQDSLQGNSGNDWLDGGTGDDTALYNHTLQNYRISYNGQGWQVSDRTANRDGIDTLQSIEHLRLNGQTIDLPTAIQAASSPQLSFATLDSAYQICSSNGYTTLTDLTPGHNGISAYSGLQRLQFSNTTVGLDVGVGQNTGEVYRLYLTVLGRNPQTEPTGCGFWIDKLDRGLLNTEQMVGNFLNSDEFVTRFGGTTNTNDAFINLMYLNLLGRDGHPDSGFNFWRGVLDNQQASRAQVVASFMESAENVSNAAVLIGDYGTFKTWVDA